VRSLNTQASEYGMPGHVLLQWSNDNPKKERQCVSREQVRQYAQHKCPRPYTTVDAMHGVVQVFVMPMRAPAGSIW
jgi:hypothetical protein